MSPPTLQETRIPLSSGAFVCTHCTPLRCLHAVLGVHCTVPSPRPEAGVFHSVGWRWRAHRCRGTARLTAARSCRRCGASPWRRPRTSFGLGEARLRTRRRRQSWLGPVSDPSRILLGPFSDPSRPWSLERLPGEASSASPAGGGLAMRRRPWCAPRRATRVATRQAGCGSARRAWESGRRSCTSAPIRRAAPSHLATESALGPLAHPPREVTLLGGAAAVPRRRDGAVQPDRRPGGGDESRGGGAIGRGRHQAPADSRGCIVRVFPMLRNSGFNYGFVL